MPYFLSRIITLLAVALTLSACQIEGETVSTSAAEAVRNAGPNSAFIYRNTGLLGGAVNMNIYVDGRLVGKVGSNRFLEFRIPSSGELIEVGMSESSEPGRNTASIVLGDAEGKPRYFLVTGDFNIVPLVVVTIMETNLYLLEVDRQTFLSQLP